MNFRTEIEIPKQENTFTYADRFFSIGSCFSEHIVQRLHDLKFATEVNPLGTLFNPVSIFKAINYLNGKELDPDQIIQSPDDIYLHPNFHSSFRSLDKTDLIQQINTALERLSSSYKNSTVLILTFGTAHVYQNIHNRETVANCHKVPQKEFKKLLLSSSEIVDGFKSIIPYLASFKKIILTVSPVRHTKDGITENQLSKSILRVACSEIEKLDKRAVYFPAYEIFMDDLRDYRFYKADLIHPNTQGIEYTFDKFKNTFFDTEIIDLSKEVENITKGIQHRSFNPNSEAHKKFLTSLLKKIQSLSPEINFSQEEKEIEAQLHEHSKA